jgi:hypothetical protein
VTPAHAVVTLPNGTHLHGRVWPFNDCWTLLIHEPGDGHDIDELIPLIGAVIRSGSSAAAFDLPGHGFSDGVWSVESEQAATIAGLLDWIDQQHPAKTAVIALGSACYSVLEIAKNRAIDVLALVSPTPNPELQEVPARFRGDGSAKLLICGGADEAFRATQIEIRQRSIGWAVSLAVGTTEQGAALLAGEHSARVEEGVELFLREQWAIGRRRDGSAKQHEEIAR